MKKYVLSALALVMLMLCNVVALTSCSEDDELTGDGSELAGQWVLVKVTEFVNGEKVSNDQFPAEERVMVMTFNTDGSCTSQWAGESSENGTWVLSTDGKQLTVGMGGESETVNVEQLSSSTLVLSYEGVEEDMGETVSYKSVMTYTKL